MSSKSRSSSTCSSVATASADELRSAVQDVIDALKREQVKLHPLDDAHPLVTEWQRKIAIASQLAEQALTLGPDSLPAGSLCPEIADALRRRHGGGG